MEQYISKSALVAEINKLYNGEIDTYTRNILDRLKSNIETLEVKYADFDVMKRMEECPYRHVGCNIGTIDVCGVTVDRAEFNKKVKELIHGTKSEHKEDTRT